MRSLVEGFARGIVLRVPEQLVVADAAHAHELRMAARDQQGEERKLGAPRREHRREQVALEVVHPDRRNPQRKREAVSERSAH